MTQVQLENGRQRELCRRGLIVKLSIICVKRRYRYTMFPTFITGCANLTCQPDNQQSRETVAGTSASITVSSVTTLNKTFYNSF